MKVCQILGSGGEGGLSKHVIELTNGMSKKAEVAVICPSSFASALSGNVAHFPFPAAGSSSNPFNLMKFVKLLRQINPDVTHAHGNMASLYVAKAKPFVRATCIGTIHWHLKRKKNRKGFESMDGVIGVSEGVLADLKNPSRTVIHNGTEVYANPAYDRTRLAAEYSLKPKFPIVVAIGRLVKGKGFTNLIKAWQGLDANLLIIGTGPYQEELQSLIDQLGLTQVVRLTGSIPQASSLLPYIDLVAIGSRSEGFSYVLTEALLHQKPIISTAVNGCKDVLPNDCLVPVDDVGELHSKLAAAISDLETLHKKFESTYQWAGLNLTLDSMVDTTMSYYQQVRGIRQS